MRTLSIVSTAVLLALLIVMPYSVFAETPQRNSQKTVLVTGASAGIGRKITERLAADGYFVYGGVRKEAELAALSKSPNIQGVHLDVTRAEDISAAVKTIEAEGRGLYGLVNNAGVFSVGNIADYK